MTVDSHWMHLHSAELFLTYCLFTSFFSKKHLHGILPMNRGWAFGEVPRHSHWPCLWFHSFWATLPGSCCLKDTTVSGEFRSTLLFFLFNCSRGGIRQEERRKGKGFKGAGKAGTASPTTIINDPHPKADFQRSSRGCVIFFCHFSSFFQFSVVGWRLKIVLARAKAQSRPYSQVRPPLEFVKVGSVFGGLLFLKKKQHVAKRSHTGVRSRKTGEHYFFFLFIQLVVAWFAKPCVDTDTYFLERVSTLCQGTGIDRIGPFWSLGLRIARLTFV